MVENGSVRVAFEVTRKGQNSWIKQIVSPAAGDAGRRVEVDNVIDWQSTDVNLKAAFPFTTENENATYNSCIFKYAINLPPDPGSVTLPDNAKITVFAITAVRNMGDDLKILFPLADDFKASKTFSLGKEGS